jgi:hypothetical protein
MLALRATALAGAIAAASQTGAQAVTGLVRDSATQRPLFAASIAILGAQGAVVATGSSNSQGRFHVTVPVPGNYTIETRRPGYVSSRLPFTMPAGGAVGDSIDGTVDLVATPPNAEMARLIDSLARHLFADTPGDVQFQNHAALGRGHFIPGADVQRSGLLLSDFLATIDSMGKVPKVDPGTPVIPAAQLLFLTTTTAHHCLNARVDHTSLPQMMSLRRSENIDDLLPPAEITGIELYLTPADVPPDLRPDAFPDKTDVVARAGYGPYSIGVVGAYDLLVQRSVRLEHPPLLPSCPFMQIWTRSAW